MQQRDLPAIVVSPYMHVAQALNESSISHVVSILGPSDIIDWPNVGARRVLRLQFDDVSYSSGKLIAPTSEQIAELVEFARNWNGSTSILVHCRAGSSRSPAAAMIIAAALEQSDLAALVRRIGHAKAYFRPNTKMLSIADSILALTPSLVELVSSMPSLDRIDNWGAIRIPLVASSER
jgi:predicted protein tyrosine phosphatase